MDQTRQWRVIIIGAGISGLSAARRLYSASGCTGCSSEAKMEVMVLEGSERIGGRIMTSEFSSTGEQIELGATWIHGVEGSPIYEIAENAGALHGTLPFECMDGFPEPPIVKAAGGVTVHDSISTGIADLYKRIIGEVNEQRGVARGVEQLEDGNAPDLGSYLRLRLDKFLRKQELSGRNSDVQRLLEQENPSGALLPWTPRSIQEGVFKIQENWERCVTAAESLHDLNLEVFNEYWEFPGEQITIARGFSSVVHALAKTLPPGCIRFNKVVERIKWNRLESTYPVQLHCQDGSVYQADHVIVTVSLGVLKAKAEGMFHPSLPQWKLEPIRKLGFGVVDKLFVLMEPLPAGARHPNLQLIHDEESHKVPWWIRKTHSMYPIHRNSNVLVAWFAGKEAKAMETLSDEEIAQGVQKTLGAFGEQRRVAGVKAQNGRYTNGKVACNGGTYGGKVSVAHGNWNKNPLFMGSYSYVAVGSSGEDIDRLAEAVPGECEGEAGVARLQLLFAGEATHREQYSTTHGAYFSGMREAERLLEHYNITS